MTANQDQLFKKALSETYKYAALLHVKDYATLSFNDVARAIKESNEFRGIRTADVQHLAESVTKHLKESVMSEIDLAISDAKADGLDDAAIARDLASKYRIGLADAEHLVAQWVADNQAESVTEATSALAQWKQKVKAAHPTATFEVRKKTDRYGSDRVEANVGDRMVGYFEKKSGRSNVLEAADPKAKIEKQIAKIDAQIETARGRLDMAAERRRMAAQKGKGSGRIQSDAETKIRGKIDALNRHRYELKDKLQKLSEAAEKSMKVYHVDRSGKKGYTVVDSAAALQDHIQDLKRTGAKITHTASMVNGQEGPAVYPKAAQVAEAFPYDVDHMPGQVIRNADMATDSVYTKDYAQWKRAVNSINRRVFDDNASLISDSNREIALNDDGDILWAQWDKRKNSGWFNSKGRQVRPYPVKENVSGAIAEDDSALPASYRDNLKSQGWTRKRSIKTRSGHKHIYTKPDSEFDLHVKHQNGWIGSSLNRPKSAVKKASSVTEAFPYDVDHMPGRQVAYQNTNCRKCHGRKFMYKLDGKLYADNKKGAVRVKCPACKGTGDISESGAISNNSVKVGDKIRTIKMGQIPGVVEKIDGDWVIFRHESGKLYRAPVSNVRLDEARSQPFYQFGPQPKRRQTAQQKAIAQRNRAYWDAQPVIEPKDQYVGNARIIRNDPEVAEEMTPTQTRERERIVKGMKKNKADFKDRYGKRGEEVMYATATKRAMGEDSDDQYRQGLRSAIEILRRANQEFQRTGDRSVLDRAHREYSKVYDQLVAANPEAHSRHAATRQVWGPAGTNESAGSIIDSRAYNQLIDMVPDSVKRRYGIDAVARATERAVDGREGNATVRDVIQWLKHDEESRGEAEDWHELQRLPRNRW